MCVYIQKKEEKKNVRAVLKTAGRESVEWEVTMILVGPDSYFK